MTTEHNISEKVKEFLTRKLTGSRQKIKKLKRKRTIYNILFISTAGSSIVISVVLAAISTITAPPVVVLILSISSGILTGISAKFGFQDKKEKLNKEITKLNKIQSKLDYVISCNGDLTQEEYKDILREFNF